MLTPLSRLSARHGRWLGGGSPLGTWSQGPERIARRRAARTALKEAASETHASTNRNRIGGGADQGERAIDREALATKGRWRKSGDGVGTVIVLTRGGLAESLKGQRSD
jgi:hypothetical protein